MAYDSTGGCIELFSSDPNISISNKSSIVLKKIICKIHNIFYLLKYSALVSYFVIFVTFLYLQITFQIKKFHHSEKCLPSHCAQAHSGAVQQLLHNYI